jgi:hypothetical protein
MISSHACFIVGLLETMKEGMKNEEKQDHQI